MKVILFGATGMVGQGVLRECLLDDGVTAVLAVGRGASGQKHAKLRDLVHKDIGDLAAVADQVQGYDACYYCLGVTAVGTSEADYVRITHDLAVGAATTLAKLNPGMTFIFVSGAGADSSGKGSIMWARVKGQTENDVLRLPFKAAYVFRPGMIEPLHGIKSRTPIYNVIYTVASPVMWLLRTLAPSYVLTTEGIGRAMLNATRRGAPKAILESADINRLSM